MSRPARLVLHTVLIMAAGAGFGAVAVADTTTQVVTGRVSAGVVRPGEALTFGGTGFAPRAEVRLTSEGASVGVARADASGGFVATVRLSGPAGFRALAGTGPDRAGGTRVATVTVQLLAGAAAAPGRSDEPTSLALLAGFGVIVVGAGARLLRQRRSPAGTPAWA